MQAKFKKETKLQSADIFKKKQTNKQKGKDKKKTIVYMSAPCFISITTQMPLCIDFELSTTTTKRCYGVE